MWRSLLPLFVVVMQFVVAGQATCVELAKKGMPSASEDGARVAVVIGNSRYPSGALVNPRNDATAIASALKKLKFDVELKLDATKADLDGVFKRFSGKADQSAVAVVFYAGHGIQVSGNNYLIPIDANPQSERDLKREMVRLDDVIDDMGSAKVKIVFFDACRDNPLTRSFSRGGSRGMAAPSEATGTLISFSTKHGNTALDGDGKNSPYTGALLAALEGSQRMEIEQLLRKVQQDVKRDTRGQQEPWRYGSLDGDFYFLTPVPEANTAAVQKEMVDKAVAEAVTEALRQANEQSAKERAETQQRVNEQAVAEALRKANEQVARERAEAERKAEERIARERAEIEQRAARERSELKESMERMLKEAIERQNALLLAEREARKASGEAVVPQAPVTTVVAAPERKPETSLQLAMVPSSLRQDDKRPASSLLADAAVNAGDAWEYAVRDEKFGGKGHRLVFRVKAMSGGKSLEEFTWDGGNRTEWVVGGELMAVAVPGDSRFMFAPHWANDSLPSGIDVMSGNFPRCNPLEGGFCRVANLKQSGTETITVAAGTFNTIRLEGWINATNSSGTGTAPVVAWYSKDQRRLIKQIVTSSKNNPNWNFKEVIELKAIHPAGSR
ncbi:caspase family protein [Propionivibrio dicarboxylicus]|nr:caspase family protein [Propionivibrio dicarboxylicus]